MGRILFGIIGLILGLIGGALFGGAILGGSAAGIGIATGMTTGVCATVIAASEEGLLTDEQVEQVMARAATDLGGTMDATPEATTVAQCEAFMQELMSESDT
ncbi:hypothetical protein roselon_00443 [Roseibacterium elongatum DSM 19469]|uniref:Uncharacterized protein n=1 Tax=Roseicyclus elongatus DSM 19469 TaxID=1294273 RepID=W8RPE7_9RHOB|nr:hypothetical protein [Roseibacterium elongatum]AHM02888.1 hypothetical protein roselon_00443 [Roseibacterium elongatum DSM 19469]